MISEMWKNAAGHLIPVDQVSESDKMKDELAKQLCDEADALKAQIAAFKVRAMGEMNAARTLIFEKFGAKIGGAKGGFAIKSFDGGCEAEVSVAERVSFGVELQAAKALIDECINEWAKGSRPELMALVQQAFQTDKEGNVNVGRILALRRLEITDERWQNAMKAIGESVQVIGTKQYVRFYERVGDSDRYAPISLDMVAV